MNTTRISLLVVVWLVAAVHGVLAQAPVVRVDGVVVGGTIVRGGAAIVALESGFVGGTAFYTLDGTEPNFSSPIYGGPFTVTNNVTVRVSGVSADLTQTGTAPGVVVVMVKTVVTGSGSVGIATQPGSATVTLTATADTNWTFHHWEDDAIGLPNPTALNASVSRVVRAVFVQTAFPLAASTPGGGNVALNPAQAFYPSNTVVTLTATSSNGWSFMRWEGDISTTLNPATVTVDRAKDIRAVFGTTVISNVLGSGDILFSAANPVPFGTVLRVTAVPAAGSYFRQWGGVLIGSNSPAEFAVTNSTPTVGSLFTALPSGSVSLTIKINGTGRVTRTPDKSYYSVGEFVYVTALPDKLHWFTVWTGDATETSNPLQVKMENAKTVEANFVPIPEGAVVAWGQDQQANVPVGLNGVTTIAGGWLHAAALKNDGTVVAWGWNEYGQTNVPAGLNRAMGIAAGIYHTVAVKSDGMVVAWGQNFEGQTNVPSGLRGVTAIAAGGLHTAAVKNDGSVVAWGWNRYGQTDVPVGLGKVEAIAAGYYHTVALQTDGALVAWGDNGYGQNAVPADLMGVTAVAAGDFHTVALKSDGTVVAWGDNSYGQITGIPTTGSANPATANPVTLNGQVLSGVVAIAAGAVHTVALLTNGTVVAWGGNTGGKTSAPSGLSGVTAIAAGATYTAAIFGAAPPRVIATVIANNIFLRWQDSAKSYRMESAGRLTPAPTWLKAGGAVVTNGGVVSVMLPATGPEKYFRLVKP